MATLFDRSDRAAFDTALNPRQVGCQTRGPVHTHTWNIPIMTDMQFGGVTIPSQQTLSPAGHDDIAFRPACDQLVPIQRGHQVFWTITLSDGQQRVLQHFPPLPQLDAYKELDAYGICKLGGADVPLVYTSQVPQRQVATVTTTPELPAGGDGISTAGESVGTIAPAETADAGSMPMWAMGAGGLLLLLVVGFLFKATQGDNRRPKQRKAAPKAKQGTDGTSALNDIFGGGRDA